MGGAKIGKYHPPVGIEDGAENRPAIERWDAGDLEQEIDVPFVRIRASFERKSKELALGTQGTVRTVRTGEIHR